jgi:hypothetical protein
MDPLPEHEIIGRYWRWPFTEDADEVLDRLRRNDPALKELTLTKFHHVVRHHILEAFDAMATNSSLKILNIDGDVGIFLRLPEEKDRVTRGLSRNTSLKDIRMQMFDSWTSLLDVVMASPNLEFLTLRNRVSRKLSSETIKAKVRMLCGHTSLHSLTLEGLWLECDCYSDTAVAFATAFQGNQTIKTLILRQSIHATAALALLEALPHDHGLEVLVFDEHNFDDDSSVRIVRAVFRTTLKVLSLVKSREISDECCTRIIQTLRENEHSLTKLNLFRESEDYMWQNFFRLEIENLTWENHFQAEKDKWLDQFLGQHSPTKKLLFLAVKRAKRLDDERFSKAPNMLFHLIKESPDFIVQAICDGHKMSSVTMSLPILAAQSTYKEGLLVEQRPSIRNKRQREED